MQTSSVSDIFKAYKQFLTKHLQTYRSLLCYLEEYLTKSCASIAELPDHVKQFLQVSSRMDEKNIESRAWATMRDKMVSEKPSALALYSELKLTLISTLYYKSVVIDILNPINLAKTACINMNKCRNWSGGGNTYLEVLCFQYHYLIVSKKWNGGQDLALISTWCKKYKWETGRCACRCQTCKFGIWAILHIVVF